MATIQGVYVALFGRPADPNGLAYFKEVTQDGKDLSAIGDLSATAEYKARFEGKSNLQIIDAIYQSLFNRAPDTAGREFFADALNKGTLNINNIAIAILDGAQGPDKTTVENKIKAADAFTAALDTATEIAAYTGDNAAQAGRNFLTGVTNNPATVPSADATAAAVKAIVDLTPGTDPTPGTGVVITFAANGAVVAPDVADPAFRSTVNNDTINAGAFWTDTAKINGGAGVDTLNATLGADLTILDGGLTNVEKLVLKNSVAGNDLDLDKAVGVQSVAVEASGATDNHGIAITNLVLGTAISAKGTFEAADIVSFSFKGAAGTSDAATLVLDGAVTSGAGGVAVVGIENLTVNIKSSSSIDLNATAATSIVVTGSGNATLGSLDNALKTLDASGLTGQLSATVGNAGVTVTGTKQADTIALNTGNDVIVFNEANKSTIGLSDSYTAVDWLEGAAREDKIDVKAFGLTQSATVTQFTLVGTDKTVVDGTSFGGNTVGVSDGGAGYVYVYFDTNKDGVFNAATDLAFRVDTVADFTVDNVIWA